MKSRTHLIVAGVVAMSMVAPGWYELPTYKMTTDTPHQITTPDKVECPFSRSLRSCLLLCSLYTNVTGTPTRCVLNVEVWKN